MKKITLLFLVMFSSLVSFSQELSEGFEGTSLPDASGDWALQSSNPLPWKVFDNGVGLAQSWNVNTIPANVYSGTRSAYLNREAVAIGTFAEDWLVTRQVTVPNNGQLRFWTRQTLAGNQGSSYTIRVSTTSQTNAASFTTIQTWTETEMNTTYNVYEEKVISLVDAGYTSGQTIYIAFVMTNNNGDRWLIDDVNVVEQCLDPTTQTATNPTLTTVDLGWDNPSGASQWEVEIVATGATPTGTGTVVNTNLYTAPGLTDSTCYDFYVRALCASGTNSEWIGPFNFCTASLGETCGAPIQITGVPYTTTDNTSGYGDDYSGSPGTGCGTTGTYLNGDDVFYAFTPTTNTPVTITSQTNSTWSGLFVYSSCANIGVSCVAGNTSGNGTTTADTVVFTPVANQTYYIVISTWAAPQSVPYTLTIVENTCTNLTSTYAVVSNCSSGTDTFYVTANVTNMGTATSIAGTTTPASTTEVLTAAGTLQFGPFPNNTPVTIHLQNEQDVNCFRNSPALNQTFCPAPNNLCTDAIPLDCNSTVSDTTQAATTAGAPTGTCGTTAGAGGVWYTYAGNGDVVTFSLCGSTYDTKIQVYTGSCGAFSCVAGNDDFCGTQSQVQIVTVPGTLYYVYVYGFGTAQGTYTLNTTCITPPPPPANDNCDTATTVTVNTDGSCTQITPGTVSGATPSSQPNGCIGTADDDVWFSFTATQATHTITLQNIAGSSLDLNHVVYTSTDATNPCGNLTQVLCSNPNLSVPQGLVVGQVYYIRVYTATGTPLQNTTFDVCVSVPPPPPSNDSCATPLTAPVNNNTSCNEIIAGTITSATASPEANACGGTADDDVWFQFTALEPSHLISLTNVVGTTTDLAFAVYSGADCNSLTQVLCNLTNDGTVTGLTAGSVYWIRVYSDTPTSGQFVNFDLCIRTPSQCSTGQAFCNEATPFPNVTGVTSYGAIGCCFTTPNPSWFVMQVDQTGPMNFQIQQFNTAGNLIDVDFVCWGPFTADQYNNNTACGSLYDFPDGNTTIPNNIVACSYSASATENFSIPNAQQGEYYIFLITNFNQQAGNFTFTQTNANSTGAGSALCCDLELGDDVVLCGQTSYTIESVTNFADSFKWYKDNVELIGEVSPDLVVTETGVYRCEILCGSQPLSDEVTVTFNDPVDPTFDPIPSNICLNGDAPNLQSTSINLFTGVWSPATVDTSVLGTTTYTFTPDAGQCASVYSVDITIDAPTTPTFDPIANICQDQAVPTLPATSNENITGDWNPATIDSSVTGTVTYTFTPTVGQCATTTTLDVTIDAPSITPIFTIADSVCEGGTAPVLSATSENSISGVWNPATVDTSVTGTITYTFTPNAGQCGVVYTKDITVIEIPVIVETFVPVEICEGTSFELQPLTVGNYYTGPGGSGSMLNTGDLISSSQTIYVYAQSGTTPNCTDESSFTVSVVDSPVVELSGGCLNNVYTITATVLNGESVSYSWSDSSGVILGATGSSLVVNQDGSYSCTVTLSSGQGCVSDTVMFLANGTLCTIQKGISPNGDGLNDNFDLTGLNVRKLEIFNRYGRKVYSYSNYVNQWYGQSDKGEELPVGTYYFVIERDNVEAESGWIYINRQR